MGVGEIEGVRGGEGKKGGKGGDKSTDGVLNEHVVALCASECLKAFFRCLILNVI